MEKVVLHRCPVTFVKTESHCCHRVQKALEDEGIEHEVRKAPLLKPMRGAVKELSGQSTVPMVEFADGTAYRAESKEMAAEIRAGRLFEHKGDVPAA